MTSVIEGPSAGSNRELEFSQTQYKTVVLFSTYLVLSLHQEVHAEGLRTDTVPFRKAGMARQDLAKGQPGCSAQLHNLQEKKGKSRKRQRQQIYYTLNRIAYTVPFMEYRVTVQFMQYIVYSMVCTITTVQYDSYVICSTFLPTTAVGLLRPVTLARGPWAPSRPLKAGV